MMMAISLDTLKWLDSALWKDEASSVYGLHVTKMRPTFYVSEQKLRVLRVNSVSSHWQYIEQHNKISKSVL